MKLWLSPSARLGLMFFIFSATWILASDYLIKAFINDKDLLVRTAIVKGIVFIFICSVLLYLISKRFYGKLQRSLAQNEELLNKYRALSEASKDGIIDYDLVNDCAVLNQQLQEDFGLQKAKIENFSMVNLGRIHPEDLERVKGTFYSVLASDYKLWQSEYRFLWSDETYHDVITRGYIIRENTSQRPLRFIGTIQDVTEVRNVQARYYEQELKNKLALGKAIINAQETERGRWAGELHDNVGQMLTVVKLYLAEYNNGSKPCKSVLEQSEALVGKALNQIRAISASIMPPEFQSITFAESLQGLIESVTRVKPLRIQLEKDGFDEERLTDQHKLTVYRVIQEQLTNIIKYAEATTVNIYLETIANQVRIRITDDGKGFDPKQLSTGIGLRNIKSRLQVFSGTMVIESSPSAGCILAGHFFIN